MTKDEHITYWVTTAEHDIDAMQGIFDAGKNDWALFVGHLAVEKILKAHWVKANPGNTPPKTHNLNRLYKESKLSILNDDDLLFLDEITGYNTESRYPEVKYAFYKLCTKEFAEPRLAKIIRLYQWLLTTV